MLVNNPKRKITDQSPFPFLILKISSRSPLPHCSSYYCLVFLASDTILMISLFNKKIFAEQLIVFWFIFSIANDKFIGCLFCTFFSVVVQETWAKEEAATWSQVSWEETACSADKIELSPWQWHWHAYYWNNTEGLNLIVIQLIKWDFNSFMRGSWLGMCTKENVCLFV